ARRSRSLTVAAPKIATACLKRRGDLRSAAPAGSGDPRRALSFILHPFGGFPMATFSAPDQNGPLVTASVTITNGTALSPAVDLTQYSLVGLVMPSGWT